MTGRHAPAPTYPSRLWLALMAAAVAGIVVPPTVLAARAVAPQVAAAEHLALTPERSAEPSAHGGPLAPLSIGVVAPETDTPVVPPVVRSSRPAERPVGASVSSVRVAGTAPAVATPSTVTTAPAIATPVETTTPPTTTAAATTTRTCRWCHHHTSTATTTETTTAATTTEATETTSEPSDIEDLIDDVIGTEGP